MNDNDVSCIIITETGHSLSLRFLELFLNIIFNPEVAVSDLNKSQLNTSYQ